MNIDYPYKKFLVTSVSCQTLLPKSMPPAVTFLRCISTMLPLHHHRCSLLFRSFSLLLNHTHKKKSPTHSNLRRLRPFLPLSLHSSSTGTLVEELVGKDEYWDFSGTTGDDSEVFKFDGASLGSTAGLKELNSAPSLDVKGLDEVPEQWRRSRLAWLCKELPAQKPATLIRILNAQRKWITQEDLTYVVVHCLRIRENDTGFRVYKWMMQLRLFRFDFSLATKLADYLGKERKYMKCREIFDDIINHGLVPTECTFHILIVAYLSSSAHCCLEEACNIYNRMIQLGGYSPRLSLHNSLFKAILDGSRDSSTPYLKQAEIIYHNMVTSGFKIEKDVYGGLIRLHSYQDTIDKERIASLREEMQLAGVEESREVLVSLLRVYSKEGNIEETEKIWVQLLNSIDKIPSQAFVHRMEVYAMKGEPMKSLEVFRDMQEQLNSASTAAFHKIIEISCKAEAVGVAESLMSEFVDSGKKPLMPAFINLMDMYLNLSMHYKVESTFCQCLEKCRPNRTIYFIYLKSLVKVGSLEKAEQIFCEMQSNDSVGVDNVSCNTILRGYLDCGEYVKAEKIYDFMCQKKYHVEDPLMEKLDYILSLTRKAVKNPVSLKLRKDQREILVGLLLGGLQVVSDGEMKKHMLKFQFDDKFAAHFFLKKHLHTVYHEWLASSSDHQTTDGSDDIPWQFNTKSHTCFGYYADQFCPKGRPEIPKLIHRWLSPRVLAYWYMYGGYRTSSGDILLKLRGSQEGVMKIVKALESKSLVFRIKRKGKAYWIGFIGSDSTWFWKLIEPFILDDLKDVLKPGELSSNGREEEESVNFDSISDSDEDTST